MQSYTTTFKVFTLVLTLTALIACDNNATSQATAQSSSAENNTVSDQSNAVDTTNTNLTQSTVSEQAKYTVLANPIAVSTGDKIEVRELFWYGCGHCFALEPFIKTWLETKPNNSEFVKTPAIFSASWAFHGQAFYTMQALGVLEEANDAFFHQIHVTRRPITTLQALVDFLAKYGQSEEQVTAAFNSFAVDTKLRNATNITKQSTATGVPAILVDGKYITSVSQSGGQSELFQVIDELVTKAASER